MAVLTLGLPTLVLITSCLHLHTLSKITILRIQIGLYHSIFKVLPAARSLSHACFRVPGVTSHWSVLGTLPLNGSFSLICLVKRGSCSSLSIPLSPALLQQPLSHCYFCGWQALRLQGFFTTSTTCCPDSQRPPSLSTWPPLCPLVDILWGVLLAKNREGLCWCGVMGDLEIALGEGPGSEAGIEVFALRHSAVRKRRHLC